MRDIKFRAWDKENREMLSVDVLDFFLDEIRVLEDDGSIFSMKFKDIELLQYTGYKDKNGTEIYEKDIVRISKNNDNHFHFSIGTISFEHGKWLLTVYSDVSCQMQINYMALDRYLCEKAKKCNALEVIGTTCKGYDPISLLQGGTE